MTTAQADQAPPAREWAGPRMGEFVALMAALMASNALAIDSMLPALPAIGDALSVSDHNRRQLVITAYLLGFGVAQIVYGPLSDRFGRKPLLVGSLVAYAVTAMLCGIAGSFTLLLAARFGTGLAAAGTRVLVSAIVRDRFEGALMAQIMSLTMIVFMIVPVLAPSFGQGVLLIASWRYIFIGLAVYALVLGVWSVMRLPETLHPEFRRRLAVGPIARAMGETLGVRQSIGNTLAATLAFGGLFAFITSVQQIITDTLHAEHLFGLVFAAVAGPMALASWFNSRLVMRLGSRLLLRLALVSFIAIAVVHLTIAMTVGETIWTFILLQAMNMACFSFIGSNASALAMQPLGHIAGTASSVQGLISTTAAGLIGFFVGQHFDGTTVPLHVAFVMLGIGALVLASWANPAPRPMPASVA